VREVVLRDGGGAWRTMHVEPVGVMDRLRFVTLLPTATSPLCSSPLGSLLKTSCI
jgi:hypothetical protein